MGKRPTRKFVAAERQIKLALYVQEHAPVTRTQIQNDLPDYAPKHKGAGDASSKEEATARRRFERDKEELARMGITLSVNQQGFYSVGKPKNEDDDPFCRCNPESQEAALLRAAASALLQDPSFVHANQLRMALAKLSAQLEIPDTLTWASKNSLEALRAESANLNGIRIKTAQALENRKLLSFDYQDAHGKQSRRNVEPIGMYVSGSFEYLAAWDTAANGKRSFRLDRMGKASVKDSGRGNPDYEPRPFNLSEWQILPFQLGKPEELVQATVAIDKDASWQARHLCSGYGSITALEDDSSLWNVSCADPNRLAEWCISNGPGLVPQKPQEAHDAYRRILEAATSLAPGAKLSGQNSDSALNPAMFKIDTPNAPAFKATATQPTAKEVTSRAKQGSAKAAPQASLAKNELLFACLALLELTGSVSIPQAARMLGANEDDVYSALEALAFCYDAVNVRLGLGERGCSFATLKTPCGLSFSLSKEEQEALTEARAIFLEDDVARIISTACTIEGSQRFIIEYWKEGTPAPEERIIEPQAMLVQNEHHYVQAWCHKVRAQRLFRLDRIISATPLVEDGGQQAAETPELKTDSSENRSAIKRRESQRPIKARIVLKPGTRVPDWPGLRKAKKQPADGSISFSVPWFESPWLAKQLASMGSCVNKVEPAELAYAAAGYAASLL